jgi:hypothetical protein
MRASGRPPSAGGQGFRQVLASSLAFQGFAEQGVHSASLAFVTHPSLAVVIASVLEQRPERILANNEKRIHNQTPTCLAQSIHARSDRNIHQFPPRVATPDDLSDRPTPSLTCKNPDLIEVPY